MRVGICTRCGVLFDGPKRGNMPERCGPCRRSQSRSKPRPIDCEVCGRQFLSRRPDVRMCSAACRSSASYQRAKADGRTTDWFATTRSRWLAKRPEKHCAICGEVMALGKRMLCGSDECRRAYHAQRMAKYVHARRAARKGADAEVFEPREVFERDGWICGICEDPVDSTVRWPDPGAPTLDHIVPLSKGGTHSRGNTQLAHFYCNSVKGASRTAVA